MPFFGRKRRKGEENDPVKDHDFNSLMNQVRRSDTHLRDVQQAFDKLKKDYRHKK